LLGREAQAFYNPSTGRWLSRDPIEEQGGRNLYAFAKNDLVSRIDPDGRVTYEGCLPATEQFIQKAIDDVCANVKALEFKCCMNGSRMARDLARGLSSLCDRGFKVKCILEPESPTGGCARGDAATQTISLYLAFISSDACGWGKHSCVIGHEMLHVSAGIHHPRADRSFNRLHNCLGCQQYRQF
jgi:hypothetical protein